MLELDENFTAVSSTTSVHTGRYNQHKIKVVLWGFNTEVFCPCSCCVVCMCLSVQPLMQRKQEHEKRRKEIKEQWIRAKRKLVLSHVL